VRQGRFIGSLLHAGWFRSVFIDVEILERFDRELDSLATKVRAPAFV
jgi:hypothetical protein